MPIDGKFDFRLELFQANGFDGLCEAVQILMNTAMVAERNEYLDEVALKVPQTRDSGFYPQSLERELRSERALLLVVAEMYVQGVSTRRVKCTLEELCGLDLSSTQVSRAAAQLDELLDAWRTLTLNRYRYILLDARYEKVAKREAIRSCCRAERRGGCRQVLHHLH